DIIVYPAHGAGSACGKNMSAETSDTLGHQKQTNYALRAGLTKEEFVKEVTAGLPQPPGYFPLNVKMNKEGYSSIDEVIERGNKALSPDAFEAAANETNALMLDTRPAEIFAKGFIPNSINIGLDGSFAPWVGALIPDIKQKILIVAEEGREEEVITRLARVGYDYTIGYLKGGFQAWHQSGKDIDTVKSVTAQELADLINKGKPNIVDVRRESEYLSEHVKGAVNLPLDNLNGSMAALDKNKTYYVHCAGGYRSMIFNTVLKARGFHNLVDIAGGFKAIKETGKVPVTDFVCPTTLNS
ncbi:MAG TPA: rhodanese-like domain-containing protein, partial [Chitinophagaceae bacterium]|nr:rhodanese-like domain-containing protein [Chitinophagaceae bacterium]